MKIVSKRQFYKIALSGACGNTMHMWTSIDSYWPYRYRYPQVCIRWFSVANKNTIAGVHYYDLLAYKPDIISEIPKHNTGFGLQGELTWFNGGWALYYTHAMGYMRDRLKKYGQSAHGWQVLRLLRHHCGDDYDMLISIFDIFTHIDQNEINYPVIEFAVLPQPAGILNRRTVIWEVRNDY